MIWFSLLDGPGCSWDWSFAMVKTVSLDLFGSSIVSAWLVPLVCITSCSCIHIVLHPRSYNCLFISKTVFCHSQIWQGLVLSLRVKTSFSYVEFSGGVMIPPSFVQRKLEVTSDAALRSGEQLQEKVFAKAVMRCPSDNCLADPTKNQH